jgi:predicted metal-binding membrane protein
VTAPLERLLKRDRAIAAVGLATLCLLAWFYILSGANLGMGFDHTTILALFPYLGARAGDVPMPMATMMPGGISPASGWSASTWLLMVTMWWIMMIAMMVPSAAPAILLYAGVARRHASRGASARALASAWAFAAGYLTAWFGFSVAATILYWLLMRGGMLSQMLMASRSKWLAAMLLIAAGLYQLTPLKRACLTHCRAPASFISRHWRSGTTGAVRLGVLHGAYCLGCCWLLMLLLFVGGVMNVVWIAVLTALVLAEKLLSVGRATGIAAGAVLIAWGAATILVGG